MRCRRRSTSALRMAMSSDCCLASCSVGDRLGHRRLLSVLQIDIEIPPARSAYAQPIPYLAFTLWCRFNPHSLPPTTPLPPLMTKTSHKPDAIKH